VEDHTDASMASRYEFQMSPRGGEHVILLPLSVHSSHHILSCGLGHHTTRCWCVCWWPCTSSANSWCPEFIRSQTHQDD